MENALSSPQRTLIPSFSAALQTTTLLLIKLFFIKFTLIMRYWRP